MGLSLSLLGSYDVTCDKQPVAFATASARALFAYLAAEADRSHARSQLAELFWPDQRQDASFAALRTTLSRIRRAIPDSPGADAVLHASRLTLQFRREAVWCDLYRFEDLLAECALHPHDDLVSCPDCLARMQEAVTLYRGEFLTGLTSDSEPFEEWLLLRREQLHRRALETLNVLTQHDEASRQFEKMRDHAARQLVLEPLREEAHAQLMRALAYAGNRAAALAQYETCRQILLHELGIEPGIELQALIEHIRTGQFTALIPEKTVELVNPLAPSLLPSQPSSRRSLPAYLTPFIGRKRDLANIASLLAQPSVRLLTLVGPGGMGKTRLAVEAVRERAFSEEIHFISLASVESAATLVSAIAATAGLELRGEDPVWALAQALSNKPALLILDNFEQLLNVSSTEHDSEMSTAADIAPPDFQATQVVMEMLQAAPHLRIIVTSREQLRLRDEYVYVVPAMDYPSASNATVEDAATSSAVQLFAQSAHQRKTDFKLNDANLPRVLRICHLVGGMPLGLQLAAAPIDLLTLEEIADEIERSVDFLEAHRRDVPKRQHSMRAVFDWSWRLLTDIERDMLGRLSVFRGGFTRQAAEAVARASLSDLVRLNGKSLLRSVAGRYEMHELLRQFAMEKWLATDAELRRALQRRYAEYYLTFIGGRAQALLGPASATVVAEAQRDLDNIRQAWQMAINFDSSYLMVDAIRGLKAFWAVTGRFAEGEAMFASAMAGDTGPIENVRSLHIELMLAHAECLEGQAKFRATIDVAKAVAKMAAAIGDDRNRARCLITISRILVFEVDRFTDAYPFLQEGYALAQQGDWPDLLAEARVVLASYCDNLDEKVEWVEWAMRSAHERGDAYFEFLCTKHLAGMYEQAGRFGQSIPHLVQCLRLAQDSQGPARISDALILTGFAYNWLGVYDLALDHLNQAMDVAQQHSLPWRETWALFGLSVARFGLGELDAALALIERARDIYALRSKDPQLRLDHLRGMILIGKGELTKAEVVFRRLDALERAWNAVHPAQWLPDLTSLAHVLHLRGADDEALACVEELLHILDEHPRPNMRDVYQDLYRILWVCYLVLRKIGDSRAQAVLESAHRRLQEQASFITDSTLRHAFLYNVPANREIEQAYARQSAGAGA